MLLLELLSFVFVFGRKYVAVFVFFSGRKWNVIFGPFSFSAENVKSVFGRSLLIIRAISSERVPACCDQSDCFKGHADRCVLQTRPTRLTDTDNGIRVQWVVNLILSSVFQLWPTDRINNKLFARVVTEPSVTTLMWLYDHVVSSTDAACAQANLWFRCAVVVCFVIHHRRSQDFLKGCTFLPPFLVVALKTHAKTTKLTTPTVHISQFR